MREDKERMEMKMRRERIDDAQKINRLNAPGLQ